MTKLLFASSEDKIYIRIVEQYKNNLNEISNGCHSRFNADIYPLRVIMNPKGCTCNCS